jgi:hypothetical protein
MTLMIASRHRLKIAGIVVGFVPVLVVNNPPNRDLPVVPLIDDAVGVSAADVFVAHTKSPGLMSPAGIHWSPTSIG